MADVSPIRLPRTVTFRTAVSVLESMLPAVASGAREIDLAGCEEFDSSLVAVLLEQGFDVLGLPQGKSAFSGGYGQLHRLAQVRNLLVILQ